MTILREITRGKAKDRVSLIKKLSKTEFSDYNFNRQKEQISVYL